MFSTSKIFLTADGVSSSELFSTVTVSTQL
jgi:hypothetical protein